MVCDAAHESELRYVRVKGVEQEHQEHMNKRALKRALRVKEVEKGHQERMNKRARKA